MSGLPSPWHVEPINDGSDTLFFSIRARLDKAEPGELVSVAACYWSPETDGRPGKAEACSNAHLIAAAPLLRDALKALATQAQRVADEQPEPLLTCAPGPNASPREPTPLERAIDTARVALTMAADYGVAPTGCETSE